MGTKCWCLPAKKIYQVLLILSLVLFLFYSSINIVTQSPLWNFKSHNDARDDVTNVKNFHSNTKLSESDAVRQKTGWKKQKDVEETDKLLLGNERTTLNQSSVEIGTVTRKVKTNIVLMKTHKTASSAVQNILMRYGLKHKLNFTVPKNHHDFNYPSKFQPSTVIRLRDNIPYNVLCHHMRFDYDKVRSIMPDDTVYVTIVREPLSLFESTFDYLYPIVPEFQRVPHKDKNSVEKWIDHADEYTQKRNTRPYSFFAKSGTFFDFGFNNWNEDDKYISAAISRLESIFDLVLIADHFHESMVLLSDLMNWSLDDITCLTVNARLRNDDVNAIDKARVREKVRKWNKADAALFDYFNATLWKKVEEYGFRKMSQDVTRLKEMNAKLTEKCVEGGKGVDYHKLKNKKFMYEPKDVKVVGYNLKAEAANDSTCKLLVTPENALTEEVFQVQKRFSVLPDRV